MNIDEVVMTMITTNYNTTIYNLQFILILVYLNFNVMQDIGFLHIAHKKTNIIPLQSTAN